MTLRQHQPVISGVLDQASARLHQPLLQAGERPLADPQVPFDEFSEAKLLVEFPHQNQAAVGGDAEPWKPTLREALKES